MIPALFAAAFAVTPPSLDNPVPTSLKSKRDAAVVLAVEDYATLPDAVGASAGAARMREWLAATRGVDPNRVFEVKDGSAAQAREALARAVRSVKKNGSLWVYWSGHGAVLDGERALLGVDADPADLSVAALPLTEVIALASGSKAKQITIIVDAGFGGLGRDGEQLFPMVDPVPPLAVPSDERVVVWAATTGAEPAWRYGATGHGLFSYLAIGALRGWADGQIGATADGVVNLQEAQGYVARVLRQLGGGEQKPNKDTRAAVNAWVMASGALEAGPSKEDLASLALAEKVLRVRKAEGLLLAVAKADWGGLEGTTKTASPDTDAKLKAFIAKYDSATVQVDGAQVAVAVPQVAEARARLDEFARAAAKLVKKKRGKKRTSAKRPPPPAPVPTAPCMELLPLEPRAIVGELPADMVSCVESRIAEEPLLTTKDKLSRLLLVNADAKGDIPEWTRLAARHLEDFDRSDPDLCYKFALVLSRGEIEDAELVLRWADYALENKHNWEGPTYTSRVYGLYRLKAETATRLWHDAETDFIEERSEENGASAERYRGLAKDLAREWLDYARTSAQPADRAFVLCESASGNQSFCASG